jgi:hypothetical protein
MLETSKTQRTINGNKQWDETMDNQQERINYGK